MCSDVLGFINGLCQFGSANWAVTMEKRGGQGWVFVHTISLHSVLPHIETLRQARLLGSQQKRTVANSAAFIKGQLLFTRYWRQKSYNKVGEVGV